MLAAPLVHPVCAPPNVSTAEIINNGTITGDRVNGLLDCQTGQW